MPPLQATDKQLDSDPSWQGVSMDPTEKNDDSSSHSRKSCLSTSNGTARQQQRVEKKVAFLEIEIREFPVGLGDNPAVVSGPPITLEWEPQQRHVLNLDAYEGALGEDRRRGKELRMPSSVREELLKGFHSKEDLKQASQAARKVQRQRQMAVALADSIEPMEVFVQSAGRKFQRWRRRRNGVALEPAEAWVRNYKRATEKGKVSSKSEDTIILSNASSDEEVDNELTC